MESPKRRPTRAFTLIDLAACISAAGVIASLVAAGAADPRAGARRAKDAAQLRGIGQSFIVWAQNNQDLYPLPSKVDAANATVAQAGRAKDTTANIFSLLIFNGFLPAEMLVSPAE